MKKFLAVALFALCGIQLQAQTADPVVMTINGKQVLRSEFEYSYNKNNSEGVIDKKSVREYVDLFVNYKLKVEAALDEHMDTMKSYREEFLMYRDQQIRPMLVTDADMEREAQKIYNATAKSVGPDGLIMPAHILIQVNQKASEAEKWQAKARIDSVYNALQGGADFAKLAAQVSQDPGSAPRGGQLPWLRKGQTLPEFETAAFALQKGQMSKPFLSQAGYHIVLMTDRKQMEPFDSLRSDIYRFMEQRNTREQIATQVVDSLASAKGISSAQLLDEQCEALSKDDVELRNLVQEYHDGLLLYEISNREVWQKGSTDEAGLNSYFKKNKKKYAWEEPRFKGMAYHTREQADIAAVKKCVKGVPFDKWADKLRTTFNADSVLRIRVEKGIFKKGDNPLVDMLVFGDVNAKLKSLKDYPYDDVFGKKLKAPEELDDVRPQVVADYQQQLESDWVAALRKKYPFSVNWEVVDTVKDK